MEGIFSHKSELTEIAAGIPVWINFAETGARVDHIYFEFNNSITQGGFTVPRRENSRENLAPQRFNILCARTLGAMGSEAMLVAALP